MEKDLYEGENWFHPSLLNVETFISSILSLIRTVGVEYKQDKSKFN